MAVAGPGRASAPVAGDDHQAVVSREMLGCVARCPGRRPVGIGDCYAASGLPEAEQAGFLTLKLSGASRDAIVHAGRKSRSGNTPSVKVTRVKCQLPSGVCIVASGQGLSLDDLIESLGEAQKEAKKAREQGLDAKTFQSVMRDKSKKRSA